MQNPNMQNQSQNKIQNPATQVPKTPQMNDRDAVDEMLMTEKHLTNSYSVALNEASHEHLYNDLLDIFNETQNMQHNLFNLMFQKGWYKLEAQDTQKIQQSFQQHSGYTSQFPYQGSIQ